MTLDDYWMGRDKTYSLYLTTDIIKNAMLTVEVVNNLLERLKQAGIGTPTNPHTKTLVSSGWRPAQLNSATPGAAPNSKHITAQACDLYDPEGEIDDFLLSNQDVLTDLGLWMEHPLATKGWCHVQLLPPASGKRVFYP